MHDARRQALAAVRTQLQRRTSPRLHMLVLVAVTSAAGLLASFLLLRAGVASMAVRYPLAVALAYVVFLALVGVWLRLVGRRRRRAARDDASLDLLDLVEPPIPSLRAARDAAPAPLSGGGDSAWDLDLDDGGLWLVAAAALALLAFGVVAYLVYAAPALLAELLLDAGLAAGLYGRLAHAEPRAWLRTAVRGTALPALAAAVLLGLAGLALQHRYPGAASIGRVIERATRRAG